MEKFVAIMRWLDSKDDVIFYPYAGHVEIDGNAYHFRNPADMADLYAKYKNERKL